MRIALLVCSVLSMLSACASQSPQLASTPAKPASLFPPPQSIDPPSRQTIDLSLVWDDKPETEEVARKLSERIDVAWDKVKFADAVAELRNRTGCNIHIEPGPLEASGIELDASVSITLTRTPAHVVLRLLIEQVAVLEPTGYVVIDGMVRITTKRQLQKITDTRVYDIRDLMMVGAYANFLSAPEFDLNAALSCTSSGGGRGVPHVATTLFHDHEEPQSLEERQAAAREMFVEQIAALIQDTVGEQAQWQAYGGEVSSLRELNGNLIIKTTPGNHRDIDRLLVALRGGRTMVELLHKEEPLFPASSSDPKGFDAARELGGTGVRDVLP